MCSMTTSNSPSMVEQSRDAFSKTVIPILSFSQRQGASAASHSDAFCRALIHVYGYTALVGHRSAVGRSRVQYARCGGICSTLRPVSRRSMGQRCLRLCRRTLVPWMGSCAPGWSRLLRTMDRPEDAGPKVGRFVEPASDLTNYLSVGLTIVS